MYRITIEWKLPLAIGGPPPSRNERPRIGGVSRPTNGNEALEILDERADAIHLLLTDVVLPNMGGREMAERIAGARPGIKVLFVSGYTDDVILHHQLLERDLALLQKPFTI